MQWLAVSLPVVLNEWDQHGTLDHSGPVYVASVLAAEPAVQKLVAADAQAHSSTPVEDLHQLVRRGLAYLWQLWCWGGNPSFRRRFREHSGHGRSLISSRRPALPVHWPQVGPDTCRSGASCSPTLRSVGGYIDVLAPDGRTVRIDVRDVVDHFWGHKEPNHWRAVPDIRTAIEHAERRYKSSRGTANRGYFARLRPDPKRWASRWFVTWTSGAGDVRKWETTFPIDPLLRQYLKKNTVGEPEWSAHRVTLRRNPDPASGHLAPARVVSGTKRPNRAPVTRSKSSTRQRAPERGRGGFGLALLVGGAILLGRWAQRRL